METSGDVQPSSTCAARAQGHIDTAQRRHGAVPLELLPNITRTTTATCPVRDLSPRCMGHPNRHRAKAHCRAAAPMRATTAPRRILKGSFGVTTKHLMLLRRKPIAETPPPARVSGEIPPATSSSQNRGHFAPKERPHHLAIQAETVGRPVGARASTLERPNPFRTPRAGIDPHRPHPTPAPAPPKSACQMPQRLGIGLAYGHPGVRPLELASRTAPTGCLTRVLPLPMSTSPVARHEKTPRPGDSCAVILLTERLGRHRNSQYTRQSNTPVKRPTTNYAMRRWGRPPKASNGTRAVQRTGRAQAQAAALSHRFHL